MIMLQATDTAAASDVALEFSDRPAGNPARGAGQKPDVTLFEVVPEGRSWLIKHNRGVLGRVSDKAEAIQIAIGLAAWCEAEGRLVSVQAN
ncbi:MAG: hypothetical protein ACOY5Y_07435 [Pseudomonadota bacterium]